MMIFILHMRSQARAQKIQAACLIWKSDACEESCLRWFGWSHGAFDAESERSNQIATMGRPLIFSCIPLESHQIPHLTNNDVTHAQFTKCGPYCGDYR